MDPRDGTTSKAQRFVTTTSTTTITINVDLVKPADISDALSQLGTGQSPNKFFVSGTRGTLKKGTKNILAKLKRPFLLSLIISNLRLPSMNGETFNYQTKKVGRGSGKGAAAQTNQLITDLSQLMMKPISLENIKNKIQALWKFLPPVKNPLQMLANLYIYPATFIEAGIKFFAAGLSQPTHRLLVIMTKPLDDENPWWKKTLAAFALPITVPFWGASQILFVAGNTLNYSKLVVDSVYTFLVPGILGLIWERIKSPRDTGSLNALGPLEATPLLSQVGQADTSASHRIIYSAKIFAVNAVALLPTVGVVGLYYAPGIGEGINVALQGLLPHLSLATPLDAFVTELLASALACGIQVTTGLWNTWQNRMMIESVKQEIIKHDGEPKTTSSSTQIDGGSSSRSRKSSRNTGQLNKDLRAGSTSTKVDPPRIDEDDKKEHLIDFENAPTTLGPSASADIIPGAPPEPSVLTFSN